MFNALTITVCILLALSFTYNIWLAYVADRYETTLMRDIDHDLNDCNPQPPITPNTGYRL